MRGRSMQDISDPAGRDQRTFEDYAPGSMVQFGQVVVDHDEVIEFARRYDPQPFHIDAERAAEGPFRGLVASGWHTASMMMRLLVDHYLPTRAGMGSPGVDELRWLAPVRPGDRLSLRITVLEARRSQSKPDRGVVRMLIEMINQAGEVVMTVKAMTMMRCRQPAAATAAGKAP
jgi:acyl dehydratase